jgi:hypothetical protein
MKIQRDTIFMVAGALLAVIFLTMALYTIAGIPGQLDLDFNMLELFSKFMEGLRENISKWGRF